MVEGVIRAILTWVVIIFQSKRLLKGDPEVVAYHGRSQPFPTPCPPKKPKAPWTSRKMMWATLSVTLPSCCPFVNCQETNDCKVVFYPKSLFAFPSLPPNPHDLPEATSASVSSELPGGSVQAAEGSTHPQLLASEGRWGIKVTQSHQVLHALPRL